MRPYRCTCGNLLFFPNSQCLACGRAVGLCPGCHNLTPLAAEEPGWAAGPVYRCDWRGCGAAVRRCDNYAAHDVCNRLVHAVLPPGALCECCRFNVTIPDLTVPGNRDKWYRLEGAKRRVLYDLDLLGLPYGQDARPVWPPLRFEFVADAPGTVFDPERAFTGHAGGVITINIREVDDLERERQRVLFGEAHRTLVGHFRHEFGHYYHDVLVRGRREGAFAGVFGDPHREGYEGALARHHAWGPPAGWAAAHVSSYAAAHPWEDFAETFATYLDMVSALDTAHHFGFLGPAPPLGDLDALVARYADLGVAMNEINRSIGLVDLVPEVLVPAVVGKLRFVHALVRGVG